MGGGQLSATHLMHLGATACEDWTPALRGWLRQRFNSSRYALTRTGGVEPVDHQAGGVLTGESPVSCGTA